MSDATVAPDFRTPRYLTPLPRTPHVALYFKGYYGKRVALVGTMLLVPPSCECGNQQPTKPPRSRGADSKINKVLFQRQI